MLVAVDVERAVRGGTAAGSATPGCRPCRRGTCIPSTGWRRGSRRRRAGVPVVDGGVELDARIGAGPGGMADPSPTDRAPSRSWRRRRPCGWSGPSRVVLDRRRKASVTRTELLEFWPDTVQVGFRIPVGVVGRELDLGVALAGELDHALDVVSGTIAFLAARISRFRAGFLAGSKQSPLSASQLTHRLHDGGQVLLADLGAGDEAATFCSSFTFQSMYSSISG
jgi:hypothetical protein